MIRIARFFLTHPQRTVWPVNADAAKPRRRKILRYDYIKDEDAVFFRGSKLFDRAGRQTVALLCPDGSQRINQIGNLKPMSFLVGLYGYSCRRHSGLSSRAGLTNPVYHIPFQKDKV